MNIKSDIKKTGYRSYIFKDNDKTYKTYLQTCLNNVLRIYLKEKLNFYYHIFKRHVQITAMFGKLCLFYYIRLENMVY